MAWPTRLKRVLLAWLLLACCLPAFAATDWPRWQAELARLHQDAIPRDEVRRRFIELQKTLPPDPPYPVQREAARVALLLSDSEGDARARREALRTLALHHGDQDTARLMRVQEIFDSHVDDNIEASLHALDALRLETQPGTPELRNQIAMAYAYMYWDVGNFELALRYLLQARDLAPTLPGRNPERMTERGEGIARLYVDMQDAPRALAELDALERDLPAALSERTRTHLAATRGAALIVSGQPRVAMDVVQQGLQGVAPLDPGNGPQRLRQALAEAHLALDQPELALKAANEMVTASRDGAPYFQAEGQILRGAAQSRLGHVEEGLASMQQGINYFRRAAQFVALRRGLGRKVDALVAAGRPADALAAQREQYDLSMRLYSSNRAQGVARLQVEEDVARREDEIRRLSTENQLQEARVRAQHGSKLAWMVVSVLGGGVILLLALLLRSTRRQREALWKDALTGAFTRHHLERWRAGHRLHAPARRALVLIDLDYFKAINDQHGHAAGDEVLRGVGARLRGELDRHGELFRWGGEEFLLVQDVPADADIEAWLARLQRVVQRDTPWVGQMLRVSASMGCLVLAGEDAEDARFDTAVRLADTALYMAKAEGRACAIRFVFAGEGLDAWHRQPPCRRDELQAWRERGWVQVRQVPAPD